MTVEKGWYSWNGHPVWFKTWKCCGLIWELIIKCDWNPICPKCGQTAKG
jgi:hypothetical protein